MRNADMLSYLNRGRLLEILKNVDRISRSTDEACADIVVAQQR